MASRAATGPGSRPVPVAREMAQVAREIDTVLPWVPRNAQRDLLIAGLALFREHGYHGTSTRAVANAAGVSDAALYVHYRSKSALLLELEVAGHTAVLKAVEAAIAAAGDDPRRRLYAFVRAFTTWHAEHASLARVVQYELHALDEPGRAQVMALRRRTENLVAAELERGQTMGMFEIEDLETTRLVLLSLGIDVARWYRSGKSPEPEVLGARYAAIAQLLLCARTEAAD